MSRSYAVTNISELQSRKLLMKGITMILRYNRNFKRKNNVRAMISSWSGRSKKIFTQKKEL